MPDSVRLEGGRSSIAEVGWVWCGVDGGSEWRRKRGLEVWHAAFGELPESGIRQTAWRSCCAPEVGVEVDVNS
jgi:hypothetical protein